MQSTISAAILDFAEKGNADKNMRLFAYQKHLYNKIIKLSHHVYFITGSHTSIFLLLILIKVRVNYSCVLFVLNAFRKK